MKQPWVYIVPHPDPPSHLPLHPIPLGLPSAPGPSACLMHPTWAGDLFHSFKEKVFCMYGKKGKQKTVKTINIE